MASSVVLAAALFLLAGPLISMFTLEPSMEEWKGPLVWNLRMYSIILPFFTIQTIGSSMLQAMKRSKRPMQAAMIMGAVRMLLFWICCGYGYAGITYALIASYVLSAALMTAMAGRELRILRSSLAGP